MYNIFDPKNPRFVDYHNTAGEKNFSPEGIVFVSAEDLPNKKSSLMVSYEYAPSDQQPQATVIYQINIKE